MEEMNKDILKTNEYSYHAPNKPICQFTKSYPPTRFLNSQDRQDRHPIMNSHSHAPTADANTPECSCLITDAAVTVA